MNGQPLNASLARIQPVLLVVGVILWGATIGAGMLDPHAFGKSYLLGYLLWLGFPLGAIGLLCLHYLVGGGWSFLIRRFLEAAASTVPLMIVLYIPLFVGVEDLYLWADESVLASDHALQHKAAYLNPPFFRIRAGFYFVIWALMGYALVKWSSRQEETGEVKWLNWLKRLSGPGILIYILTFSFASIDWIMSLDPHWFSTIHGLVYVMGQGISALALSIICIVRFGHLDGLKDVFNERYLRDLGTLLFAFVMLWAYMCFSQYLIIWSANLPEETPFYIVRSKGLWGVMGIAILILHFMLPFSLLLSRGIKRQAGVMTGIAILILVMRLVDMFWYIGPSGAHGDDPLTVPFHIHWMDLVAPIGIGCIWLSMFIRHLRGHNLMPTRDPRLADTFKASDHH